MDDSAFDKALIAAAFDLAGRIGWGRLSVAAAATQAGLPLGRARARFPGRRSVLLRFGVMADQAALADTSPDGSTRDRLFDMLMRRIDVLQAHRDGLLALLRVLPTDPPLALLLALATRRSIRWSLEAAGISTRGLRGELRVRGLVAVWLWPPSTRRSVAPSGQPDGSTGVRAGVARPQRRMSQGTTASRTCRRHRSILRRNLPHRHQKGFSLRGPVQERFRS
jgi:AcrR family transcriptional regulator